MKFSKHFEDPVDMSEAYLTFIIENYDKYMSVSFTKDSHLKFKTFSSEKEMADSLIRNLNAKTSVYYFKKSDYDQFIRKGIDLTTHLHHTKRNKEVAKRLKERYIK